MPVHPSGAARALCFLLATIAAVAPPARATAAVGLSAPSCEGAVELDALSELVELEIDDVAAEWRDAPRVQLECAGERVRITIADPVTDKSVARTVAMPAVDRERVLALAIAQLFLTSWLELVVDREAGAGPGAEEAERLARAAVEAAVAEPRGGRSRGPEPAGPPTRSDAGERASQAVGVEPAPTVGARASTSTGRDVPVGGELALEGGLRLRTAGEGLATVLGGLRGLVVLDAAILVGATAVFEWGRAFRERGTVDVFTGALGVVAGWRSPELGPLSFDVTGDVSLAALAMHGVPTRVGVHGGTTIALVAEAGLEVAPSLRAGSLRIALPLAVSGVAFAPSGQVSGEAPIVTEGLVLSAGLRVSLAASL